jgi:predicted RNA-binding Zn-ribbon protein involved in translation (DUF1610 family)
MVSCARRAHTARMAGHLRSHLRNRFTSTPETAAPHHDCPACGRPLIYRQTVFGGLNPAERRDYYDCRTCGPYIFRHRTGRLLPAAPLRDLD